MAQPSTAGVISLSPATAYATKGNIRYPGTQTAATADETNASNRVKDQHGTLSVVTVTAGSIVVGG